MATGKASTDRFVAAMCRESYYQFFLSFWPLTTPDRLNEAWYIREFCNKIQEISERVFRDEPKKADLVWNTPPGTTKSTIVSRLWQPWVWTRMPSARFITGSYTERLALDLARSSRDVVASDKYRRYFPEVRLRDDQNTKGYFMNTAGGFRYSVGVGGSVIGVHAHFLGIDDPIDPEAALSDALLEETNSWASQTLSRRKVNVMLTPTVLVQQRLHQNDLTGAMLERGTAVEHFVVPGDDSWEVKPPEWRRFYENGLLDPARIPREALEEALATLGEFGYAGQYGQNPVPKGGAMFKVALLQYADLPLGKNDWKRGPVRFWDKAATRGGGAYTVGVLMGLDRNDRIWILDVERFQLDSGARERRIDLAADRDGFRVRQVVEKEPAGAGKESAENTVRRLTLNGYRAAMQDVSGDKALRADPLSTHVNTGNVILVRAPWNKAYVEELRFFPRSRYKDQVDASSGAFIFLVKKKYRVGAF